MHDERERRQRGTVLGGGSRWRMTEERDVKEAQCLVEEAGGA